MSTLQLLNAAETRAHTAVGPRCPRCRQWSEGCTEISCRGYDGD